MNSGRQRPKNLNLLSVRFPLSAIMSVGHRAAGIVLFLALPYGLYLFQLSFASEEGFMRVQETLNSWGFKVFLFIIIWSLTHHLIAGIRYFLLDLDIGVERHQAQKSALVVMLLGAVVAFVSAGVIFL